MIVTADHGESLGEHGELTHGMFAYEATLRVPLIIARVEPGERRTRGARRRDRRARAPRRHRADGARRWSAQPPMASAGGHRRCAT